MRYQRMTISARVTITKDYVEKKGGPLIQMRGTPELADSQHV